jgi:DNA gyrase inhibitor GyrI
MTIQSKPSNDDYREGWERIFGVELAHGIEQGRERFLERQQLLNPNDADEHPPAD